MMETGYNGYANYETWSVSLFIDNESREAIREATRAARKGTDALKDWFEEYFLTDENGEMYGNMVVQQFLNAAMGEVDWAELVDHYTCEEDDFEEETEYEYDYLEAADGEEEDF